MGGGGGLGGLSRGYSRLCMEPFRYKVSTSELKGSLRRVLIFRSEKCGTTRLAGVVDARRMTGASNFSVEGPMFVPPRTGANGTRTALPLAVRTMRQPGQPRPRK